MHYRFRLVASSGKELIMAGHLSSLPVARRALQAAMEWSNRPQIGALPPDVENMLAVSDARTLKVSLTLIDTKGNEEILMTFEPDGRPIFASAEGVWPLVKKALEDIQ